MEVYAMGDEWKHNPQAEPGTGQPNQDEVDKRLEDIKRSVTQGANEAQQRIKRVIDKASGYWQQAQTIPTPRQASSEEEQRIRQLANMWSSENWRIARELGSPSNVKNNIIIAPFNDAEALDGILAEHEGEVAAGI